MFGCFSYPYDCGLFHEFFQPPLLRYAEGISDSLHKQSLCYSMNSLFIQTKSQILLRKNVFILKVFISSITSY